MEKHPLDINSNDLYREWLGQAKLAYEAGVREADASLNHAQKKLELEVVCSSVALDIYRNPSKYDLRDKPTEAMVKAAVALSEKCIEAETKVNQAKRELDLAKAEVTAFVDRRKALERLVELLQLNYFSEQEPRAQSEQAQARVEEAARRDTRRPVDMK